VNVLGIDLSSKAIDLVLLDENANRASWTRLTLEGPNAFERARDVAEKMPQPGWYEAHGVYLVAIERPFVSHGQDVIRLVQGAVLAEIPRELHVWEVSPSQWKSAMGIPVRQKPEWGDFPADLQLACSFADPPWTQDALDALGVALYARDENAKGIADALNLCPCGTPGECIPGTPGCAKAISDALSAA
jgi:hypothetical protein